MKLVAYDADVPLEADDWSGVYDLSDNPLLAGCIDERRVVVVRATDRELPAQTRDDLRRWGDASELWVPMVYQDTVLGLLTDGRDLARSASTRRTRSAWPPASRRRPRRALQNARAYERLETRARRARPAQPATVRLRRALGPDARPARRGPADRSARPGPARGPRVQPVGDLPLRRRRTSSSGRSRPSAARPRSTNTTPPPRSPPA